MRPSRVGGILALAIVIGLAALFAAGCGGDGEEEFDELVEEEAPELLTPDDIRANLEEAGYVVGDDVTSGATEALAGGSLTADLLFSVEADPEGRDVFATVYFFSDRKDAETLAEFTADEDSAAIARETRVYTISGTEAQLEPIVEAGEGG
jgi:AmiR/NasT family two-component response regulator